MRYLKISLFAVLSATSCTTALRFVASPARAVRDGWQYHRPTLRSPAHGLLCMCEAESEPQPSSSELEEKRRRAKRLALEAERAALEAEELELQAQQLKLDAELFSEEATDNVNSGRADASAADVTQAAAEVTAPASAAAPSGGEEESGSLFGLFNISAEALPPPPPLTYGSIASVVERANLPVEKLQLSAEQVSLCRDSVFDIDSFYVMRVEQSFIGTIFRGNLRTNSSIAYARVVEAAAKEPTLRGVQFMLLDDPIALTLQDLEAGEDQERRPVFLALPPEVKPADQSLADFALALAALFSSTVTTLGFALSTYLLADGGAMLAKLEEGDIAPLEAAYPIAVGLFAVQLLHELAHLVAARRGGVQSGVPFPLPSLQLGFYGCITRLLAFAPTRQALFDFAFAGPAAGLAASLALYAAGLALSVDLPIPPMVDLPAIAGASADPAAAAAAVDAIAAANQAAGAAAAGADLFPVVPAGLLQSSIFLGTIAEAVLPALSATANSPVVALHPLAVVGFIGALTNALQLLPIGRLDGGRVASAVLGQGTAGLVSGVSLLLVGLSTIFGGDNPVLLFFGLAIIFFQRAQEVPCLDDVTGVSDASRSAAVVSAVFALLVILPLPAAQVAVGGTPPPF